MFWFLPKSITNIWIKGLEFGDATLSGIYFPDINTYFLGEETADKKTENVESDSKAKSAQLNNGGDADHKEKERLEKSKEAAVTNGDSSETSEDDDKKDLEENDEPPRKKVKKENSVTQAEFFKSTSTILQQQTEWLFSQKNSVHISHSFFRLVHEAGRSGEKSYISSVHLVKILVLIDSIFWIVFLTRVYITFRAWQGKIWPRWVLTWFLRRLILLNFCPIYL